MLLIIVLLGNDLLGECDLVYASEADVVDEGVLTEESTDAGGEEAAEINGTSGNGAGVETQEILSECHPSNCMMVLS